MSLYGRVFLLEAVKGGLKAGEHEIHGVLHYEVKEGDKIIPRTIRLTHDESGQRVSGLRHALGTHADVLNDAANKPTLHVSVVRRGWRPEDDGHPTNKDTVAEIHVVHPYKKTMIDPDTGEPIVVGGYLHVAKEHRRKGWGTTLYDHVRRTLKHSAGSQLRHDMRPDPRTAAGSRWVQRKPTTGLGEKPLPPHRYGQEHGGQEAAERSDDFREMFPQLGPHHRKIESLANRVLDRSGGYFGKREVSQLRSILRRKLGIAREHLKKDVDIEDIFRLKFGKKA